MGAEKDPEMVRAELAKTLDEARWDWLRPHAARDVLITVSLLVDILDVGVRVALDDRAAIEKWIVEGKLTKPSREQLDYWEKDLSKRFSCLVVAPYVLMQEVQESGSQHVH